VVALVSSMRSRRRLKLADDRAALIRMAAVSSSLARERSRKMIPFSVAARSLSWLMQRVPKRVWAVSQSTCTYNSSWHLHDCQLSHTDSYRLTLSTLTIALPRSPVHWQDERQRRQILHQTVCKKLLDLMLLCRPPPPFKVTCLVNFVYGDQTYKQRGSSRRAERLEFIGSDNLPLNIEREVVFNSVHLPVPQALTYQIDAAAVTTIYQHGSRTYLRTTCSACRVRPASTVY
jgi:hypothetical protein